MTPLHDQARYRQQGLACPVTDLPDHDGLCRQLATDTSGLSDHPY